MATEKNARQISEERAAAQGEVLNSFKDAGVGEFIMESHSLSVGDEILITGPTTGVMQFLIEEIRVNEIAVEKAQKGETFSIRVTDKIRPSDKFYKLVDSK